MHSAATCVIPSLVSPSVLVARVPSVCASRDATEVAFGDFATAAHDVAVAAVVRWGPEGCLEYRLSGPTHWGRIPILHLPGVAREAPIHPRGAAPRVLRRGRAPERPRRLGA